MLAYDASGAYHTFTITAVQPSGLHVQRTSGVLTHTGYAPNTTTLVEMKNVVYSLKTNAATGVSQLVSREGATGSDVPVVDHLVGLRFDYYGDPAPPVLIAGSSADPAQPRATYGPAPPHAVEPGIHRRLPGG